MGTITDVVRRYVPSSYKALVGATNSYDYGMTQLQALADFVQFRLFSTIPGSSNEATVWDANETELLGVLTTLQFIPAAVDYWGDALSSEATSGTNEDVSYFDRRPDLWRIHEKLVALAGDLAVDVGVSLKRVKAVVPGVSYYDNGRGILSTPDPTDFPLQSGTLSNDNWPPWSYEQ